MLVLDMGLIRGDHPVLIKFTFQFLAEDQFGVDSVETIHWPIHFVAFES